MTETEKLLKLSNRLVLDLNNLRERIDIVKIEINNKVRDKSIDELEKAYSMVVKARINLLLSITNVFTELEKGNNEKVY